MAKHGPLVLLVQPALQHAEQEPPHATLLPCLLSSLSLLLTTRFHFSEAFQLVLVGMDLEPQSKILPSAETPIFAIWLSLHNLHAQHHTPEGDVFAVAIALVVHYHPKVAGYSELVARAAKLLVVPHPATQLPRTLSRLLLNLTMLLQPSTQYRPALPM